MEEEGVSTDEKRTLTQPVRASVSGCRARRGAEGVWTTTRASAGSAREGAKPR